MRRPCSSELRRQVYRFLRSAQTKRTTPRRRCPSSSTPVLLGRLLAGGLPIFAEHFLVQRRLARLFLLGLAALGAFRLAALCGLQAAHEAIHLSGGIDDALLTR